jgi:site-specific recombinase XerD
MIDSHISPLRQRMIEDMTVRHFKEKVQKDYIRRVRNFTVFLGRSPDTATSEDLRLFQLHMTRNQFGAASVNCAIIALRFFFKVTLERADLVQRLTFVHEPRKAPTVLGQEEVARLLEAAPGVKFKAAFGVAYAAGSRASITSDERARLRALERENRELRQANEILRKASGYFAQGSCPVAWCLSAGPRPGSDIRPPRRAG